LAQEAAAEPVIESAPRQTPAPRQKPAPAQKSRGHARSKRQAQQQQHQPQPRRISQPPEEPQPQYSPNLPAQLRALLRYQAETPYNIFANQVAYHADKSYVPHYVNQQQPQQQQLQQQQPQQPILQQAQYQGQGGAYQAQASSYTQANIQPLQPAYNQNQQYQQLGYNQQQSGVRPVTENQY